MKLEVQVQPSVVPKPYPLLNVYRPQPYQNVQIVSPPTPVPDPFETVKPHIDPSLAASVYQQHHINLNPTYNPLRDPNVIDPNVVNALLHQQYYASQSPNNYDFRQNVDGSVSTSYTTPSSQQNRPPFFNWFGTNNNNYQSDQQQQGPVLGFLTNLAQNNPLTNFLNNFQQQNDQSQNPLQSFLSNINPFNLFSNNNRPQQTVLPSLPIQSDYVSTMAPSNPFLSNNIDSSVFSNDHFLNPNQFPQTGYGTLQSVNFNPGVSQPTPIYNPNFNSNYNYNHNYNPNLNQYSTTNRPNANQHNQFTNGNNIQPQPYSQFFHQNPSSYPVYQNPYQSVSPITLLTNPIYNNKRKTSHVKTKKKNKNKVDVPETDSDWFNDFLDKRKEASLDVSSRKPTKKASEEDDTDLDDYFR